MATKKKIALKDINNRGLELARGIMEDALKFRYALKEDDEYDSVTLGRFALAVSVAAQQLEAFPPEKIQEAMGMVRTWPFSMSGNPRFNKEWEDNKKLLRKGFLDGRKNGSGFEGFQWPAMTAPMREVVQMAYMNILQTRICNEFLFISLEKEIEAMEEKERLLNARKSNGNEKNSKKLDAEIRQHLIDSSGLRKVYREKYIPLEFDLSTLERWEKLVIRVVEKNKDFPCGPKFAAIKTEKGDGKAYRADAIRKAIREVFRTFKRHMEVEESLLG